MVPAMRARASRISLKAMGRTGPGHDGADLHHLAPRPPRRDDVARFAQGGFARVDEDAGGGDEIVVQFAPLGAGRADRIDVGAWRQPSPLQDGCRRARGDHHDVGTAHGIRRASHGLHPMLFCERLCIPGTPHAHLGEGSDLAQRREVTLRLHAGSEDREHRRVPPRSGQPLGRHRRRGGGPHLGDEPAVHHGERLPCLGLEQHDDRVVCVDSDVLRIERDQLGPESARVGRHDREESMMRSHGKHGAHRLHHPPG